MFHLRSATLLTALTLALAAGCASEPPRGYGGGRVDPSVTTGAEVGDKRIYLTALEEFANKVPQDIARDIGNFQEIGAGGMRSTIVLGDIQNKTDFVSSTDFEMAMQKIRSQLLTSNYVRGKVKWVEARGRLAAIAAREGVGTVNNPAGPEAYDPSNTYALTMDVYRSGRGQNDAVNQYFAQVQLVNLGTNEILINSPYQIKQAR